jgi:spermidine synthase
MSGAAALVAPRARAGWGLAHPDPSDVESDYFCIRVIPVAEAEGAAERMMVLDHLVHGGAAEADPLRQMTVHAAMLDSIARERMAGRDGFSAFFIGGGTYSIPRAWAAQGIAEMTVAEIDPAVTRVAAERFWADHSGWRVVHADARRLLAQEPAAYDVVIGDAFTDIAVPAHLITREFFALVASRMTPDGVFLMNVIDSMDTLDVLAALLRTADAIWPVVEVWASPDWAPGDAASGQRVFILVGARTPTAVARTADGVAARVGARSLAALRGREALVLTDDFAPIDRLIAPANAAEFGQ